MNFLFILFLIVTLGLSGCQQLSAQNGGENNGKIEQETTETPVDETSPKPLNIPNGETTIEMAKNMNLPRLEGTATVVMKVNDQPITIEVDGNNAPITAGNFVDLVQKGIYNGVVFHRVVKDPSPFVVQGGDPQSTNPQVSPSLYGTGGYIDPQTKTPRNIPLEIRPEYPKKEKLDISEIPDIIYSKTITTKPELKHDYGVIAMARSQMPDSASSQFYFTLADLPFLDGNYAVFGRVLEGMDIVENIKQGDRIESAEVVAGAENLK